MESLSNNIGITLLAAGVAYFAFASLVRRTNYPPGPRRLPIVGNAFQIPKTFQWLTFSKWAEKYGSIVYLEAVGQPLVLLNSYEVAKDLLEQRSAIYSDRPHLEMAYLSGYDKAFVLQPYNDNWRQQRKILTQDLGPRMIPRYHTFKEGEARLLTKSILDEPSNLEHLIKLRIAAIILRITYGHYISADTDPFLTLGRAAMDIFSRSAEPGVWLVDAIPILKKLPTWVPGTGFLHTAAAWRQVVHKAAWEPYMWAKRNLESGTALLPNTCATALEASGGQPSTELEEQLVWAACMMMEGGMDTSMISAMNFFHAMLLNPAVQKKAQKEIDSVIGLDRLPTIEDKDSLPYVKGLVTEVLRLRPAIPLGLFFVSVISPVLTRQTKGVPHALVKDDLYEGMHLPKGSVVIPNAWHMLHDPDVFPNPMEFQPERYNNLDSAMKRVTDVAFGFGRRLCPGKAFGEGTLFAIASTVLATCDITPPR
ncbi:putative monooxygenase [Mycena alexandri]|uniref:Monooxygenase n=1 Tax=Mycena alexandri TaxID=1745969 RepID=A0AAD6X0T2_9AGAR|nr:putative monooxygenase [Mycena alexandri]